MPQQQHNLQSLAEKFSVKLVGDGSCKVDRVADLEAAQRGSIAFLVDSSYEHLLDATQASALICSDKYVGKTDLPLLVSANPQLLFAQVAALLHPDEDMGSGPGAHPTAFVDETADVDSTAYIGANAVVEAGSKVGSNTFVGPGCVIRRRAVIGQQCKLVANVTICHDCVVGDRVIMCPAVVVGSDGFGLAKDGQKWVKIPQLGRVVIGNDVELGAGVAIDRGALRDTVIANGVKLDNQIHIAHNVRLGVNTVMAAQSGIAGSTEIGDNCAIGGAVGFLGHLSIADGCRINAFSTVAHSILESGEYGSGIPVEPAKQWRKNRARFKQLDDMARRIRELEKKLEKIGEK